MNMLKKMFCGLLMAACLFAQRPASGGEFASRKLDDCLVHLSVRSPRDALANLDAYLAAATRDAAEPLTAGIVLSWVREHIPVLLEDFGPDLELHALISTGGIMDPQNAPIVILANADFELFRKGVEEGGGVFAPAPADGEYLRLTLPPALPGLLNVYNSGNGLIVAGAGNPTSASTEMNRIVRKIKNGWRPRHWADGALGLAVNPPDFAMRLAANQLDAGFSRLRERLLKTAPPPSLDGADGKILAGILDFLAEGVSALGRELAGIKRLGLDLRVDEERLGLRVRLLSAPETLAGRLGAAASGRPAAPDLPLSRQVGSDADQLVWLAPWEETFPGFRDTALSWLEQFAGQVFPEQREALLAGFGKLLDSGLGEQAGAIHFQDGFPRSRNWVKAGDPEKFLAAQSEIAAVLNSMWRVLFPVWESPDGIMRIREESAGGISYRRCDYDPAFLAWQWRFLGDLLAVGAAARPQPEQLGDFTLLMAAGDDYAAMTTGPSDDAGLIGRLAGMLTPGGTESSFAETPAAKLALADLQPRQILVSLANYDFLPGLLAEFSGGKPGWPEPEKFRQALRLAKSRFRKSSAYAGFALGGEDGALTGDWRVPAAVVNSLIHNFGLLFREAGQNPFALMMLMKRNERTAFSVLEQYRIAQTNFRFFDLGRFADNTGSGTRGYADNFRNLFHGSKTGLPDGKKVWLMSREMAAAYAGAGYGTPPLGGPPEPAVTAAPYQGYLFLEPPGVDFQEDFALVAYPARFGQTGTRLFHIDRDAVVRQMRLDKREGGPPRIGEMPALLREEETPSRQPELWEEFDYAPRGAKR